MPGFALDTFEPRADAFARARLWREHRFLTGQRPGRGLVGLYEEDFPEFTSTDFWADVRAATPEDPRQHTRLSALLAGGYLEGRTRDYGIQVTRTEAGARVRFEDEDIAWREAPARWSLLPEVARRHELEEAWRRVLRSDVNPVLARWQEALRGELTRLGADDWIGLWSWLRELDAETVARLAQALLDQTAEIYGNGLGVYLGQLELPIDDAWISDVDWAFRAPRFGAPFTDLARLPTAIRVLRDLGIELEEQTNVKLEYGPERSVTCLPLSVPDNVRVILRLLGGWRDYARTLRGTGMAEHFAHTDPSLRVWERLLGDRTPTIGYGFLLEGLLRDRTWLLSRLEYEASDDFRVIAHLAWVYRLRTSAATALFEQRFWQAEPGTSLASDYEEALTDATRVRHFSDDYLRVLLGAPWSTLQPATKLRAEVFAAQLRSYLQREFDEEWWRSNRAARFIKDELWRPGRRHTAEELLGFMGYEGFDDSVLVSELQSVLQPL